VTLVATSAQTIGPFFRHGLDLKGSTEPFGAAPTGPCIEIAGSVLDAQGAPAAGTLLEVWQCAPDGRFASTVTDATGHSAGFARIPMDEQGRFRFVTLKPGVPEAGSAPHIAVVIFGRGLLAHLHTRIYFEDQAENGADAVLLSIPAGRRSSVIASSEGKGKYRFDLHLSGERETVFFEF
jgi:protocatechuate 3,4-dioxygenase alpha subunit